MWMRGTNRQGDHKTGLSMGTRWNSLAGLWIAWHSLVWGDRAAGCWYECCLNRRWRMFVVVKLLDSDWAVGTTRRLAETAERGLLGDRLRRLLEVARVAWSLPELLQERLGLAGGGTVSTARLGNVRWWRGSNEHADEVTPRFLFSVVCLFSSWKKNRPPLIFFYVLFWSLP